MLSTIMGLVVAQDKPARRPGPAPPAGGLEASPTEQSRDVQAIGELLDAFVKAYNAKDAKALGALFTQNAEIQDEDGEVIRGRDAIVARYADTLRDSEGESLSMASESLRFPGADLAIEEGTASLSTRGGQLSRTSRYEVIYAREGGRWLHARIRDDPYEDVSPHERLQELSWMLGEWVNESDNATVFTSCTFSKDGNFLLREFEVEVEGRIDLSGSQRIAWDARRKQFRMWVFDTKGGFADGLMFHDGDRWVIKSQGVRSDGSTVTATNAITPLGKDRLRWESSDRTIGDTPVVGIDSFTLVRRPPVPGVRK
jgi:uncharacterized protein (TIGR02246 family)